MSEQVQVWREGELIALPKDQVVLTDRSRILARQACPQKRYYGYECGPSGMGVTGTVSSEYLVLGSAVHAGLEYLLKALQVFQTKEVTLEFDWNGLFIAAASEAKADYYKRAAEGIYFAKTHNLPDEIKNRLIDEQANLAYGLVWSYAVRHAADLCAQYEIVAVEPEMPWLMDTWKDGRYLVMMSRPDAILRDKGNGGLWTVSWKTAQKFTADHVAKLESDLQTLTEGMAVKHMFGQSSSGTYYGYFVKGGKGTDKELGIPRYDSSLVRPWRSGGLLSVGAEQPEFFKYSYDWYDNGQLRKLGRDWKRCEIWNHVGMQEWLDWLNQGWIQQEAGRDWIGEVVGNPTLQMFSEPAAEQMIEAVSLGEYRHLTSSVRERHTERCFDWGTPCWAFGLCWRGETVEDRLMSGMWMPRTPNHEMENLDRGE